MVGKYSNNMASHAGSKDETAALAVADEMDGSRAAMEVVGTHRTASLATGMGSWMPRAKHRQKASAAAMAMRWSVAREAII